MYSEDSIRIELAGGAVERVKRVKRVSDIACELRRRAPAIGSRVVRFVLRSHGVRVGHVDDDCHRFC